MARRPRRSGNYLPYAANDAEIASKLAGSRLATRETLMMRNAGVLLTGLFAWVGCALAQSPDALFPRPESLEPAVTFWTRVYTEVDTQSGFVHDNLRLDIVYETLRFPDNPSSRQRRRITNRAAEEIREILGKLGRGERENLSRKEAEVLALWPANTSNGEFAAATKRVRFQLGQADRFREGLVRSGIWKTHIYTVLEQRGLPKELAALPHVESSFDPTAYSRVGAAGLWQFTRSTGLRYMQIDHIVDERRDPFLSTYAAARLLQDNYAVIQSWPLALTAYNHGLAGMRRAAESLKTKDIGIIVDQYNGRTFGFASRNFYAAFLAASNIDANPEQYFGELQISTPPDHALIPVPDYMSADTVASALGISRQELQRLNPSLMETVWEGDKFIPKGYELRLASNAAKDARARLQTVPATERYAAQRPDVFHRVASGDTLSQIADRYHVSLASLVRINGLRSRNFIRIGQVLTLPLSGSETPPTLAEPESATDDGTYIVRRGDSIDRISRRLGVDAAALMAVNGLGASELIFPGQSLAIPGGVASASEPVVAQLTDSETPVDTAADAARTSTVNTASTGVSTASAASTVSSGSGTALIATTLPNEEPDTVAMPIELSVDVNAPAQAPLSAIELAEGTQDTSTDIAADTMAADGLNALASAQADLAADPSDYSVAGDGTIEVQAMETLGHYADWLEIRTQRLRDVNSLPFDRAVVLGQRIELDLTQTDIATFERRRIAYQRELQESFFSSYQIDNITDHVVRPGESLWILAQRIYNVPVWLLRQYNPDLNLDRVSPGMVVKFPNLRRIS